MILNSACVFPIIFLTGDFPKVMIMMKYSINFRASVAVIPKLCDGKKFTVSRKLSKLPFSNCQNFPFQTVKISLFKLSKFPFPNCQNFLFKLSKFSIFREIFDSGFRGSKSLKNTVSIVPKNNESSLLKTPNFMCLRLLYDSIYRKKNRNFMSFFSAFIFRNCNFGCRSSPSLRFT